jgi:ribonuclease HI
VAEYLRDDALHIFTDGSSLPGPRRGGVGIVFVSLDEEGYERRDEYPLPGFAGATNNEMEIQAAIEALDALHRGRAPVDVSQYDQIIIWTDSLYVAENFSNAMYRWPSTGWMTRDGNPVVNARLWKELTKAAGRVSRPVHFHWVKGHKTSAGNKRADKLAKQSAKMQTGQRVSRADVRRKKSTRSVETGSVAMLGQMSTIRIISADYMDPNASTAIGTRSCPSGATSFQNVDWIFSERHVALRAGHTYVVRFNNEQGRPRVVRVYREVGSAT